LKKEHPLAGRADESDDTHDERVNANIAKTPINKTLEHLLLKRIKIGLIWWLE